MSLTFLRAIRSGNLHTAMHLRRRREGEKQSLRNWDFTLPDSLTENDEVTLIDKFRDIHYLKSRWFVRNITI